MTIKNIYFHTLSPLHVGAGRGTGLIDLPIVRERATNLPILPGSSVKGVIRESIERLGKKDNSLNAKLKDFFGMADNEAMAAAVSFSDAYVLCLPVRAFKGTFAWVTCPQILARYKRDLQNFNAKVPVVGGENAAVYSDKKIWNESKVILEDLDLNAMVDSNVDAFAKLIASIFFKDEAWKRMFLDRFVVISDEVFDFIAKHATEVRARIRIDDETRIVAKGALWYEESLPAETLLTGIVWQDDALAKGEDFLNILEEKIPKREMQFGGKATTGLGRMLVTMEGSDACKNS